MITLSMPPSRSGMPGYYLMKETTQSQLLMDALQTQLSSTYGSTNVRPPNFLSLFSTTMWQYWLSLHYLMCCTSLWPFMETLNYSGQLPGGYMGVLNALRVLLLPLCSAAIGLLLVPVHSQQIYGYPNLLMLILVDMLSKPSLVWDSVHQTTLHLTCVSGDTASYSSHHCSAMIALAKSPLCTWQGVPSVCCNKTFTW